MRSVMFCAALVGLSCLAGCGTNQPKFDELFPVTGTVTKGGKTMSGGSVVFEADPPKQGFLINSDVKADGTFSLSTVRTTDSTGERKPGAPAGKYKVTYTPSAGDQTAGYSPPVVLSEPITVESKPNELKLELLKK